MHQKATGARNRDLMHTRLVTYNISRPGVAGAVLQTPLSLIH